MESFRYHQTNCFFIRGSGGHYLAVEAGWACTLREYQRELKKIGIPFKDIQWCIVTHFHMDHAGLVTDFIENGIECLVFENQVSAIEAMEKTILKNYPGYHRINKSRLKKLSLIESQEFLRKIGINGEVVLTPGHSDDSISFIFDNQAIIGDLYPFEYVTEDDTRSRASWKLLREKGVKVAYPAHAGIIQFS